MVDTTAADDDGACAPAPGDCSLPEAIAAANARPGRDTLAFDPAVFAPGSPAVIAPTVALAPLSDRAGAAVDGSGAGVILDGAALSGGEDGLVIQSGAGAPLSGVVVQNLTLRFFPGTGLLVCGGAAPDCDEDVARTRVAFVDSRFNGGNGISIDGRANSGATVADSEVSGNALRGVNLNASLSQALTKARILRVLAEQNDLTGINLNASGDNIGSRVVGATAEGNGTGINVNAGGDVSGTSITSCRARDNGGSGVLVNGAGQNTGTRIRAVTSEGNGAQGVGLNAGLGVAVTRASISGTTASLNGGNGLDLDGSRNKITKSVADGNAMHGINLDAETASGGNQVSRSRASGNGGNGIRVAFTSTANKLSGNTALGNAGGDLEDENPGCADNAWSKNVFGSANEPCIE